MYYSYHTFRNVIDDVLMKQIDDLAATVTTSFRTNCGQANSKVDEALKRNEIQIEKAHGYTTLLVKEVRKRMDCAVETVAAQGQKEELLNDTAEAAKLLLDEMKIATGKLKDLQEKHDEKTTTVRSEAAELNAQVRNLLRQLTNREKKLEEREELVARDEARVSEFVRSTNLRVFDKDIEGRRVSLWLLRQQRSMLHFLSSFCTCPRFCEVHCPTSVVKAEGYTEQQGSTTIRNDNLFTVRWNPPSLSQIMAQTGGKLTSHDLVGDKDQRRRAYLRVCNSGPMKRSASCTPVFCGDHHDLVQRTKQASSHSELAASYSNSEQNGQGNKNNVGGSGHQNADNHSAGQERNANYGEDDHCGDRNNEAAEGLRRHSTEEDDDSAHGQIVEHMDREEEGEGTQQCSTPQMMPMQQQEQEETGRKVDKATREQKKRHFQSEIKSLMRKKREKERQRIIKRKGGSSENCESSDPSSTSGSDDTVRLHSGITRSVSLIIWLLYCRSVTVTIHQRTTTWVVRLAVLKHNRKNLMKRYNDVILCYSAYDRLHNMIFIIAATLILRPHSLLLLAHIHCNTIAVYRLT